MKRDLGASIDYRAFLESTPVVPWEVNLRTGRLTYVGPQAVTLLGHSIEAWLDRDFWTRHVLPDDQAALLAARHRLATDGGSHVIEYRMEHAAGHLVWLSETATAEPKEGRVRRLRGLLSDVTERKRLEDTLAQDEARLRALVQAAPDALIFTKPNGAILNLNEQARLLIGYSAEEVVGSSIDELVPARLRPRLRAHRHTFLREPERQSLVDGREFAVLDKQGDETPVELSMSIVPVNEGRRLLHSLRDLTPRRRLQPDRWKEPTARPPFHPDEVFPAVMSEVDGQGRYRYVSDVYAAWHGYRRADMIGRTVREVLTDDVYRFAAPAIERVLAGEPVNFQALVLGQRGDEHAVEVTYVPRRHGERVVGYFTVVIGVSQAQTPRGEVWDLRQRSLPG